MSFVTHLECGNCGRFHDPTRIHNLCTGCERPLLVRYDLTSVKRAVARADLARRPADLWRYREMLPIDEPGAVISLGESMTPLLVAPRLGAALGVNRLYIKDESRLPTGSFKARGMAIAISRAAELGIQRVAVPTAGNAGGALAAYASRAGIEAYVFMPEDTPSINKKECWLAGAKTYVVNGLITDCGRVVREGVTAKGWFDVSTLKEPYRLEGKKTMGFEIAEQFDWVLPDVILYPTGGGTGLIGMWKAFAELDALGWLDQSRKPRLIACQSDGCAPIATAYERGDRFARTFERASTIASGIRVPAAVGDFLILDAVRQSGGIAMATPEADIQKWMRLASSCEGIGLCPEAAVCLGALEVLLSRGTLVPNDRILILNTGAAQKYPEAIPETLGRIDIAEPIDWTAL